MRTKLLTVLAMAATTLHGGEWMTGYYYGNWGQPVGSVPYSKYSHLIYAFMAPNADGTLDPSSAYLEDLPAFVANAHAAGTKALIGLGDGGWRGATSSNTRAAFVANIEDFVDQFNLDGVDLDWEQSIDDSQYAALIQDLRAALGPDKVLSIAAYGGNNNSPLATVVLAGPDQVNQINLMNYDMDIYENLSWFNTAIHSGPNGERSIEAAVNEFVGKGIPISKVGIGIPFYGHHYLGSRTINQPKGTQSGAWVNYFDLVTSGRLGTSAQHYDSRFGAEYLSYANEFWPFTGPRQITEIVWWGKTQGVGGYMAFDLNMEYVASASGDSQTPLSTALKSAIDQPVPPDVGAQHPHRNRSRFLDQLRRYVN